MKLKFNDINPFLRNVNIFKCKPNFDTGIRRIYTYYLLYIHKGKGRYIIDENEYQTYPGEIYLVEPGVKNRIIANKNDPFILSGIDFDFVQNYNTLNLNYPLSERSFEEKYMTEKITFTDNVYFPDKILLTQNTKVQNLIYSMVYEINNKNRFSQGVLDGCLKALLFILAREVFKSEFTDHTVKQIEKILTYVRDNFDKDISNIEIAYKFNYNKDYISRLVKTYTGISLKEYIINLRINQAIFLLNNTDLTITEIAKKSGFNTPQYFSRMFKLKTGKTPSTFK